MNADNYAQDYDGEVNCDGRPLLLFHVVQQHFTLRTPEICMFILRKANEEHRSRNIILIVTSRKDFRRSSA